MYAPVVEYSAGGKTYRFTSSMATREPIGKGGKVVVRYLPSDPRAAPRSAPRCACGCSRSARCSSAPCSSGSRSSRTSARPAARLAE
jgi:hypothetical protein